MEHLQATADPRDLIRRVSALIQAGQTGAARPLLDAARRLAGPSASLSHLAAMLALRDGSIEEARGELDLAIAETPDHPGLRKARAEFRHRIGDLEGATRDAAEAVILDRDDPVAKALLGSFMLQLGHVPQALACLREAVGNNPTDPAFREALAQAQVADGDFDAALANLQTGIALAPTAVSLRNAAVMLCIRRRDFTGAARLAEEARAVGIADACLFGLFGHALSSLGRHEEAAHAYREALKLGPEDPYVRHLVATSGDVPRGRRAPEGYLRAVFDGYADRFESHLISLGYRIPGVVRGILARHPAIAAGGSLLDLGCGTGLVGLAVSDLVDGPITGIDISARMLDQARVKGVYARLVEADIMGALAPDGPLGHETWPLIVAADVLCYFGALDDVLTQAASRLTRGGWFLFSLETLLPDHDGVVPGNGDWALLRQGRYAHAPSYVQRAAEAAGLVVRSVTSEAIRHEAGIPVDGMVVILERPRHDG